jgi:hypothetical protein
MGAMKQRQIEKRMSGTKGASKRRTRRDAGGGTADWASVDARLLGLAVAAVAYKGGALRLGYTSDGGAYAVGVYGDGDMYTDYIRPSENMEEYLRELIQAWDQD